MTHPVSFLVPIGPGVCDLQLLPLLLPGISSHRGIADGESFVLVETIVQNHPDFRSGTKMIPDGMLLL